MRSSCALLVLSATFMIGPPSTQGGQPKDLLGSWIWGWTDGAGLPHKHVLEVEGSGDKIAARERFDEMKPVRVDDLKVVDKTVSFTVRRGDRRSSYTGTLKNPDLIDGMVIVTEGGLPTEFGWSAKRMPVK